MESRLLQPNPTWRRLRVAVVMCLVALLIGSARLAGGQGPQGSAPVQPASVQASIGVAPDYVIGPTDVLGIVFREDRDMTSEVTVRPDGKITLVLLNEVVAAGLTPEQLRRRLIDGAMRFMKDPPTVTVVVRQANNNRAFITGQVGRPGPYAMSGPTTVLQLIAMAGGFTEYADRKHVLITRVENGEQVAFSFNYDDVVKRRDLTQNRVLKAGDTVVVP